LNNHIKRAVSIYAGSAGVAGYAKQKKTFQNGYGRPNPISLNSANNDFTDENFALGLGEHLNSSCDASGEKSGTTPLPESRFRMNPSGLVYL